MTSCVMRVDMTLKEETISGSAHVEGILSGYDRTLAISVALSSIDARPPHVVAESLEEKMRRDIEGVANPPARQEGHKYQSTQWLGRVEKSLTCGSASDDVMPKKILLFAPPKSGKTVLQHQLMTKGHVVLDEEDLPNASVADVNSMMTMTTVVTNRLDVLQGIHKGTTKVVFLPKTRELLRRKLD